MPGRHARTPAAAVAALVLAALTGGPDACGLINPSFTPIHLVEDSALILKITFGPVKDNRCACTIVKALKGKAAGRTLTIDFRQAINENEARRMAALVKASGGEPGVCFIGEAADAAAGRRGFLHVSGQWLDLGSGRGGPWQAGKIVKHMESCWAGGTDMLLRAVDYILTDEDADFPCKAMVSWSQVVQVGQVAGRVTSARPVDVDGTGKPCLFVTSAGGDRLFQLRDGALKDVTAERKLRSKSLASAWLDANADGRIDLASWDGSSLRLYVQGADGAFALAPAALAGAGTDGCLGLSAVGLGPEGKCSLLVSTRRAPVLLAVGGPSAKPRKLVEPDPSAARLGEPAACLVADFDGDSFPDVVQPFEKGSLFYRGQAAGGFAAPAPCAVAVGRGPSAACTGDFDADGALDIFAAGQEGCEVWQNVGKGRFVPRKRLSGEIAYISKPGGIACQACDINNDGRQDFFIAYRSMGAQLFFNRGFRSTGHAHELDLTDKALLRPAEKGQQAGCIGDFNVDGAQDMALVLPGGGIHVFFRDVQDGSSLSIHVGLSARGSFCGPLTVTGWLDARCLGAWNVTRGGSTGFVGLMDFGRRKVKWRLPGGKLQENMIPVEDGPVRFLIPHAAKRPPPG